jgi:hypothetical protein
MKKGPFSLTDGPFFAFIPPLGINQSHCAATLPAPLTRLPFSSLCTHGFLLKSWHFGSIELPSNNKKS